MGDVLTNPLRVGLRQERVVSPQCLVIFGASGDLTHRKLIPALFELFRQRRLPSEFAVLGCARRPWSDAELRQRMAEAMAAEIAEHSSAWEQFSACLFYESVDLQDPPTMVRLGERLARAGLPTVFTFEGGYAVAEVGVNVVNALAGFVGVG